MRAERDEFKRSLNITIIFQMSLKDKKILGKKLEFLVSILAFRFEFFFPLSLFHMIYVFPEHCMPPFTLILP